jgi:prephenate dehydratase
MTSIGYQGIAGSNSEAAAKELAAAFGITAEYVPLVNSRNVVASLDSRDTDYGVVATRNIVAGPVGETEDALRGRDDVAIIGRMMLPIHHCVFARRTDCTITSISSHVQALMQCRGSIGRLYPDAGWIETDDTALSAEMLSKGMYPDTVAVLCRRNAGEMFGLCLIRENIEDDRENMTEFALLKKVVT